MPAQEPILAALKNFARDVTAKTTTLTAGEPEDQLRAPFESFMAEAAQALHIAVVCTGEARLAGRMGPPALRGCACRARTTRFHRNRQPIFREGELR